MALRDLVISHSKARDLRAVEMIDRLERHRAAIDFPTSDFRLDHRALSKDLKSTIKLLLDYHEDVSSTAPPNQ